MNTQKTIFCSGAGGFIGQYLAKKLLEKGYAVHGLYTETETDKVVEGVIPHKGNLKEYEEMGQIVQSIDPDYIIHLAAQTEVEKSFYDPISFSETNYCGTVNLIEKSKDLKNLKLFVFASTMETYGDIHSEQKVNSEGKLLRAFDEETEQKPNAPYAVAKLGCEKYLEYAGRAYNFPYTMIRTTNCYGRWDNDFFVTEQIITQMLKNPDEIKLGYKNPYRNFLYIDDLIDLYLVMLEKADTAKGHAFCTGPDNALSMESYAKMIADKLQWKGKIVWDTKPKRAGEVYYLNSSNQKAERLLGWSPQIDLKEGLSRTIKIWKDKLEI